MPDGIKDEKKYLRSFAISGFTRVEREDGEDTREIELSFSSEEPYERWFGIEILSHDKKAINLDRMNNGGALLNDHDHKDQIGVVKRAWVDETDKKCRAIVRFSRSTRGEEAYQDVLDGIRQLVSVGYMIDQYKEKTVKGGPNIITATKWMPYECSLVAVPADATVGVGREFDNARKEGVPEDDSLSTQSTKSNDLLTKEEPEMPPETKIDDTNKAEGGDGGMNKAPEAVDIGKIQAETRREEQERVRSIMAMAERHALDELGRKAVEEGTSYADFNKSALDALGERNAKTLVDQNNEGKNGDVDLERKDQAKFSLHRMMKAIISSEKRHQDEAAFELEVCSAARQNLPSGFSSDGLAVPERILSGGSRMGNYIRPTFQRGPIQANSGTTGDSLIADVLTPEMFIEIFRNSSALAGSGMMVMSDLVGNIQIPRQKSASAPAMAAQNANAAESDITFEQVTMSPKRGAVFSSYSKQLLLQSTPDIEMLVRMDFAKEMGLLLDKMGLYGSGSSNQPTGIINTTGINLVTSSASAPTYAEMVEAVKKVKESNAMAMGMMWINEASGWEDLMTKLKSSADTSSNFVLNADSNTIVGIPFRESQQMTAEDHLLGDFTQLICGEWGALDFVVDPYTAKRKDNVEIVVNRYFDFAVRQPKAFCIVHDG